MVAMKTVTLPGGQRIPALGLGTWHMGETRSARASEVAALRGGLDLGLTVIDTAEMYASGGAEEVVAEAVSGRRNEVFIVSKVMPQNASRKGTISACEASLKRLRTDRIELYLLHWRGSYPLADTVASLEELIRAGKVVQWGVSNFDSEDMAELARLSGDCAANQVLYHLASRGIEWQLLPSLQKAGIVTMAYCPLGQGRVFDSAAVMRIARQHGVSSASIALAWLLTKPNVLAIPKSAHAERVRDFARATDLTLDSEDLAQLDKAFPPPRRKEALDMS